MAQHSRSTIIPTASKPTFVELMRLSDDAYEHLLTSLVNAEPTASMPGLFAEVESRLETLMANPDELFISLLSLYVLRERAAKSDGDQAKVLASFIQKTTWPRKGAREADENLLAYRLRVLLSGHNTIDETVEPPNTDPPGLGKNHPMVGIVGRYEDDPAIDAYLAEIQRYRDEVTERELAELALSESE